MPVCWSNACCAIAAGCGTTRREKPLHSTSRRRTDGADAWPLGLSYLWLYGHCGVHVGCFNTCFGEGSDSGACLGHAEKGGPPPRPKLDL